MVDIGGKADVGRALRNPSRLAAAIPATIQREQVARAAAETARKPANKQTSKQRRDPSAPSLRKIADANFAARARWRPGALIFGSA